MIIFEDDTFKLYYGCSYYRATADMHLHGKAIDAGVVTDFLTLGNATQQGEVRLNDVRCLLLEILPVAPAGIYPLAGNHGYFTVSDHPGRQVNIEIVNCFLIVQAVNLFPCPAQLDS